MSEEKRELPYALLNCPIKFNPFQYDAYNLWSDGERNLFITDEVGLGKTIEVGIILKKELIKAEKNKRDVKFLIVVPKFLCSQWKEQLEKHFYIYSTILENGRINNKYYPVYILPLSQLKNYNLYDENLVFSGIVVDEVHYYRNNESSRYNDLSTLLRKNTNSAKIFLSATPINNSIDDWYNEIKLFDSSEYKVIHNKKMEAFPETNLRKIETIHCKLNEEEKGIYNKIEDIDGSEFEKTIYRHIGASSLYALHQCYSKNGYDEFVVGELNEDLYIDTVEENKSDVDFEELKYDIIDDSKTKKMIEKIRELFESFDKIVIFAHYLETCKHLCTKISSDEKLDCNIFSVPLKCPNDEESKKYEENYIGKLNLMSEQADEVERFKNSSKKAILVCSDMLKEGVNLQCANVLFNYDLPFNPAILEQRIGRIDRVGQEKEIFIYNFIVDDTYDIRVYYKFILGKLGIVNEFVKMGKAGEMNVSEEKTVIGEIKYALHSNEKETREYLIAFILNAWEFQDNKEKIKEEKEKLSELNNDELIERTYEVFKNYRSKNNEEAFKKKLEYFREKYKSIEDSLDEIIYGNAEKISPYCFKVKVDYEKVLKLWHNGRKRILLSKVLFQTDECYDKVMLELKDSQSLPIINNTDIKDEVKINYGYLNPVYKGDWNEYLKTYIPLEIIKEIM